MADTGHLVIRGFKAGAIKYTLLDGLTPNPGGSVLNGTLVTMGFGQANTHKLILDGFSANPGGGGGGSGSYYIFGDAVIR